MKKEAKLEIDENGGLVPEGEGWYVMNLSDCRWSQNERFGMAARLEPPNEPFADVGMHVHVLQSGQPACHYHRENSQEDFLVLSGECLLIVEGQERSLKAWDFVHCPPGVTHLFVGAGDGPCALFMLGHRKGDEEQITYPVSELAARHGGSAAAETTDPKVSYADVPPSKLIPSPWTSLIDRVMDLRSHDG